MFSRPEFSPNRLPAALLRALQDVFRWLGNLSVVNPPLFWAILIGWVMSVTLHEFAHGVVAYWGGDYTIRERGGLTE